MARKKVKFYRHCQLRKWIDMDSLPADAVATRDHDAVRAAGASYRWTWSWLPEEKAVVGKWLKLKNRETGEWVDGWLIVTASEKETAERVEAMEMDYKKQRDASDI